MQRVTIEPVRSSEIVVQVFPDVAREHAADIEDHRFRRHYFLVTPMSASGSQVASSGNAVMIARQRSIMRKKGSDASAT